MGAPKFGETPATVEQWSLFEVPDEIVTAWQHELMKKTGINAYTINEPYLLFHSLNSLDKLLDELGFDQMRLPVVQLQLILLNTCVRFEQQPQQQQQVASLYTYVRLKLISICTDLNLTNSIGFHQQALTNLSAVEIKIQQETTGSTNPLRNFFKSLK